MTPDNLPIPDALLLSWVVQDRILLLDLAKDPDADLNFYDVKIGEQLDKAGQLVDLIMYIEKAPTNGFPSLTEIMGYKHVKNPHMHRLVLVASKIKIRPIGRFIISVLGKVSGLKVKTASSLTEALNYLTHIED